ncbi:MAG: GtrA family protein [Candidatus Caldarchaeum sp.]
MKYYEKLWESVARHIPYLWRFSVVGLSGAAVNHAVFTLLLSQGFSPVVSSAAAVELSVLNNFVLNDVWTFRGAGRRGLAYRLGMFHVSRALGAAANVLTVAAMTGLLGANPNISNLVGIALAMLLNYFTSVGVVWRAGG